MDGLGDRRWYWLLHIFVFMCSNTQTILILLGSSGLCVLHLQMTSSGIKPKESCRLHSAFMKCLIARRNALEKDELNDGVSIAVQRMGGRLPGYGHVVSKTKGRLSGFRSLARSKHSAAGSQVGAALQLVDCEMRSYRNLRLPAFGNKSSIFQTHVITHNPERRERL